MEAYVYEAFSKEWGVSVTPAAPEWCIAQHQLGSAALCTSACTATLLLLMVVFGQKHSESFKVYTDSQINALKLLHRSQAGQLLAMNPWTHGIMLSLSLSLGEKYSKNTQCSCAVFSWLGASVSKILHSWVPGSHSWPDLVLKIVMY